jgi:hypothetical protein
VICTQGQELAFPVARAGMPTAVAKSSRKSLYKIIHSLILLAKISFFLEIPFIVTTFYSIHKAYCIKKALLYALQIAG